MYIGIKINNNKRLVQCINRLTIEAVHVIIEISKLNTYIYADIFI